MTNHIYTNFYRLIPVYLLAALFLLWPAPVHAQSINDGLVGYWPFDRDNIGADLSGSGNTVTFGNGLGGTTIVAPTRFANSGALLSVIAPNSNATAPGNNIDGLQNFTVAFWVRLNSLGSGITNLIALNNKASFTYQHSSAVSYFAFGVSGPTVTRTLAGAANQTGVYYHIAGTYDSNGIRFYINGHLVNDIPGQLATFPGNGVLFSSPTAPLDGMLDDVRVYSRGLNAGEIAELAYQCGTVTEIPTIECQALVDLFLNTNGPLWTNHGSWLQNATPCTWDGVLCNNGHVVVISLPRNNLSGPLPASLGNLSQLIVLQLNDNQLNDVIPASLGSLSQLVTLDLYDNQLQNVIPPALGQLSKLQTLRLQNNHLVGDIPTSITALVNNLLTLDIGYNELTATDPTVIDFLNSKQPNWNTTQNVPPSNLHATVLASTSISLTWTPIAYTADAGYYEVLSTTQTSGIYKSIGKTASKSATGFMVTGLTPGQSYSFLVRTFTPKHGLQQNDLLSDSTAPIMVTITANKPPVAANDSYTTNQDTPLTINATHGLLANDSDPEGAKLTIGSISGVNPGSKFALNLDGSFTYTPALGFVGTETFTYQASDGQALSNQATVSFQVNAKPAPQSATITIALDVQPDSKTDFNFTGSLGNFKLDDITPQDNDVFSNNKTFSVPAGIYTVTEPLPSGWANANISCNPPANTIADLTKNQIVINVASGTSITCTFVTQRTGQLIAGKYNDHNHNHNRNSNDEWLRNWQMQLHNNLSGQLTNQVTDQEGRTVFTNLRPGSYTICEVLVTGWHNITPNTLDATYHQPCYTVTVAPGQAVWTRFGNSTTPLVSAADETPVTDIVVCDLPATDDDGNEVAAERDPWEEEEQAANNVIFLPIIQR